MPRVCLLAEKVRSVVLRRGLTAAMVVVASVMVSAIALLGMTGCEGGWSGFRPGISIVPLSATVIAPGTATFSVVATGTAPLEYQWTKNGVPIVGATGSSYTTPPTSGSDDGELFAVTVTNVNGSVTTAPATLTVHVMPTLTTAPVSQTVIAPGAATFSVAAAGTAPFTYQWFLNGVAITGATGATYTTGATSGSNSGGVYTVAVTNVAGTVTSPGATLTVNVMPSITTQPASVTVTAPAPATFSVAAAGTTPFSYQWSLNGVPITGATGATYTTPATTAGLNGGVYTVAVTNAAGTVVSSGATLTVITTPIATSLVCSSTAPKYNSTITVTPTWSGASAVIGTAGPGSSDITTAAVSGTAYTTPGLTAATTYTLTVTGGGGATATTSCTATPTPVTVTAITPANSTVTTTATVTFVSTATGGATNTLTWTATGGTLNGSVWTPPAVNGTYTITATSVDEPTAHVSTTVTVNLAGAPSITTQPVGVNVCANQAVSLSVAATGATGFQWDFNGTPITGATNASYSIASAQPAQSGSYTCVVSNATAGVLSSAANVLVGSTISTNPASTTVFASQVGTFTVAAAGEPPYTYQWYEIPAGGGAATAITGATTASYITPVTTSADSGTQFYATVTDSCGTTYTSTTATMTVASGNVPPTITTQPVSQAVAAGATTLTFTTTASGTPTITYQWYRIPAGQQTGSAVLGATSASYTVPGSATTTANNEDRYYVIATNAYGQASSQNAAVVVDNGILLAIGGEPVSQYVNPGQSATFTVSASSTASLTYQWYEAAPGSSVFAPITGATSASYTVSNTTTAMYGSVLYAVVSNGSSSVTSNTAGLYVGPLNAVGSLCNPGWLPHGSAVEVIGAGTDNCSFTVTSGLGQAGQVVWPQLIATGNLQLNFTITLSNATYPPADGFTLTLGDPSQGATATSIGSAGQGLGAQGIPGFVLGFDTYQNGPPDAPIVPYVGVTRGNSALFENPWFNYNDSIGTIVSPGQTIASNYVVTLVHGQMTVTQNGRQIFSGAVTAVPPVAYLYVTASTGGLTETVAISNMTVVVSTP